MLLRFALFFLLFFPTPFPSVFQGILKGLFWVFFGGGFLGFCLLVFRVGFFAPFFAAVAAFFVFSGLLFLFGWSVLVA